MKRLSLSPAQVLDIRTRYATTRATGRSLGDEYGISESTVLAIAQGETYPHLPGPIVQRHRRANPKALAGAETYPPVDLAPMGGAPAVPTYVPPMPAPATPENAAIVAMAIVKLRSGSPPMVVAHVDHGRGYAQVSWFDASRGLQVSTAPISALEVVRS